MYDYSFFGLGLQSKLSYWQSVYNYMDLSPQADDGLLTVSASLARHASHKVENGDSSCSLKVLKVLEVTSYFNNDSFKVREIAIFLSSYFEYVSKLFLSCTLLFVFKGSLVRFEAAQSSTQEILELETWVSPVSHFNIIRKNQVTIRLKVIAYFIFVEKT